MCAITSGAPNACQVSAHWATSRSMTFSPPPPIRTGIRPRTGGGLSSPESRVDHRQGIAERLQAGDRRAELVAVLGVVALEPARAQPEDQASARDVVDRARHVGQQVRVAVGVAGHERAEVDALRGLRHRGQQAPALEVRAVGIAEQRVEVIPCEERVGARVVCAQPGVAHLPVGAVLRRDPHADADGPVDHESPSSRSTTMRQLIRTWPGRCHGYVSCPMYFLARASIVATAAWPSSNST